MLVAWGFPPETYHVLDQGGIRNAAQVQHVMLDAPEQIAKGRGHVVEVLAGAMQLMFALMLFPVSVLMFLKGRAAPAAPVESADEPLPTEPTPKQTEAPAAPVESADESAASDWAQPAEAPKPAAEAPKKNAKGRK